MKDKSEWAKEAPLSTETVEAFIGRVQADAIEAAAQVAEEYNASWIADAIRALKP